MRRSGLEGSEAATELTLGAVDVLPAGELEERLAEDRPLRIKLGIDPTAPDIHLGHVVVLEKLRQFQAAGHVAVMIIGDYTARVGDPSGRSELRPVLSPEEIAANSQTFQEQAFKVLDPDLTEVRFNSEWLDMPSAELFGLARRFTVARLLERDDFTNRMAAGEPISLLELLYPVLQGYDSVAVEADLELGGTEQRFNLLFGRDVQSSFGRRPQMVMTLPILPGTDGVRKMSKSLGNYVGVTEPAAEIFGKLMSVPDDAMPLYWELLLGEELDGERHPNEAKREFARRICDRFAGPGSGAEAEARFNRIHQDREIPADVPVHRIEPGGDVHLPVLLREAFGISSSEARRMLAQGAVKIDGEAVGGEELDLPSERLADRVVQLGKRRFVRVQAG
ncbi:MAG: tyrosine--tRNA ligase [Solirubrobacterales bacterium]|nr:tyrosine--tRNA ligase [Solirubrobacterales bacterium]